MPSLQLQPFVITTRHKRKLGQVAGRAGPVCTTIQTTERYSDKIDWEDNSHWHVALELVSSPIRHNVRRVAPMFRSFSLALCFILTAGGLRRERHAR